MEQKKNPKTEADPIMYTARVKSVTTRVDQNVPFFVCVRARVSMKTQKIRQNNV